jgi:sugar lactone lactonase YvrE
MSRRGLCSSLGFFALVAGCAREEAPPATAQVPELVTTVSGFETPESVRWDATRSVFYVSNVTGNPGHKDNNGYISRVRSDGSVDSLKFIAGGRDGVTLHSPKGMFLHGDTLWVADIDAVRAFDVTTGAHLVSVDVSPNGAVFLNDVTRAPDGTLYVSDTRFVFGDSGVRHQSPDRVYRIGADRSVSTAVEGDTLGMPNGVFWDVDGQRLLIAALGPARIFEWKPGDTAPSLIAAGPGGYDGVEAMGGGRFLLSAQDDSSISVLENGNVTRVVGNIASPGDIGWDPAGRRVFVPLLNANQVMIWRLP